MGGYVIAAAIAIVVTLVIAIPVSSKIAVSRYKKDSDAKIGTAEEKARAIIDDALKSAEAKKRESLLEVK
jgi:ribonuclease Y